MTQASQWQFGLILAYLIPGFIGLAGIARLIPLVGRWLSPTSTGSFDIGPTFYAALAAIAVGMILSCFRWLLIDQVHRYMGIERPTWNDQGLHGTLGSFDYLVQNHFRYYEFCGNTLLALLWAYGINRVFGTSRLFGVGTDIGVLIIVLVLFLASRDALTKYYERTNLLLGSAAQNPRAGEQMFNGNDHGSTKKPMSQPRPAEKPADKPTGSGKPQPAQTKGDQASK